MSCLISLSAIIIALNSVCLFIIVKTPILRNRASSYPVASLLFTHLLQGIFVTPMYAAKRWNIEDITIKGITCDLFRFSYMITNYASCLTLVVISIDRLLAIKYPLKYNIYVTNARMVITLALAWIYVIVLCSIPFIPQAKKEGCKYRPQKEWTTAMLIGNTLFPFVVFACCYLYIFAIARNVIRRRIKNNSVHETTIDEFNGSTYINTTQDTESSNMPRKRKTTISFRRFRSRKSNRSMRYEFMATKMSFIIIIVYIICWGPSFMYYLLHSVCPKYKCYPKSFKDSRTEEVLNLFIKLLTFADAIAAPLIYCWKHKAFRSQVNRFFTRKRNRVQDLTVGMSKVTTDRKISQPCRKISQSGRKTSQSGY